MWSSGSGLRPLLHFISEAEGAWILTGCRSNRWGDSGLLRSLLWKWMLSLTIIQPRSRMLTLFRLCTKCPRREGGVDTHMVRKVACSQLAHPDTPHLLAPCAVKTVITHFEEKYLRQTGWVRILCHWITVCMHCEIDGSTLIFISYSLLINKG